MTFSRSIRTGRLLVALLVFGGAQAAIRAQSTPTASASASMPTQLSNAEYWKLSTDMSEPGGYFRIPDNFTSNEMEVGYLFTQIRQQKVSGGVYLGVGPEQNLSYIASIRPTFAVLFDIRRQAAMQHLMFKAIFELSRDRADFIAMLFAKPRPAGLDSSTGIQKVWDAFWYLNTDTTVARKNSTLITDFLTKTKGFALTTDEVGLVKYVYDSFIAFGPTITTNGRQGTGGGNGANTFADMTGYSPDATGQPQSFLSTEDNYRYLRDLHSRNLILTVTGDFGGPKAIRAVGDYLKAHNGVVSAFYVSNVEQYLFMDGKESIFYGNVGALPVNEQSIFIRPYSMRNGGRGGGIGNTQSLCPIAGFLRAVKAGMVYNNNDALACPVK